MKKLLSIILTLALLLSLSTLALAADLAFDFDSDAQGWGVDVSDADDGGPLKTSVDTSVKADGAGSLKVEFEGGFEKYFLLGPSSWYEGLEAGQEIKFKVFVPADANVTSLQPFLQYSDAWTWADLWFDAIEDDQWVDVAWTVPDAVADNVVQFGILFNTSDTEAATVYVDSIDDGKAADAADDDDDDGAEDVKTGYGSMLPLILMAGASSAVLIKRRKK